MKRDNLLFVLPLVASLIGCGGESTAPVDFPHQDVKGRALYKSAQLNGGKPYAAYGDTLTVQIWEIDLPARCLLASLQIGAQEEIMGWGEEEVDWGSPSENDLIQERLNHSALYRKSDSSALFLFEFLLDGELNQSCALLTAPFDTLYRLATQNLSPLRKLYVVGWDEMVMQPIEDGDLNHPRRVALRDSLLLRWGETSIDTFNFSTDSTRQFASIGKKARILRTVASQQEHVGILRTRTQQCKVTASSCESALDTLYRTIAGERDTLYRVVSNGRYELVSEIIPGEKIWGNAYQILRGTDTLFVRTLSSSDSIILDTLYYVVRGGDTTLSTSVKEKEYVLDFIERQSQPDTVEQIERTFCLNGSSWCPSSSLFEKTVSTDREPSTHFSTNWQTVLVEKSAPCERVNSHTLLQYSDLPPSDRLFPALWHSSLQIEYFQLNPEKEKCVGDDCSYRGWIIPSWKEIEELDSLELWWKRAGERK